MKRVFFLLVLVVAMAVWCLPSFAAETITGSGTLGSTGVTDGVIFNNGGSEQTLTVLDGQNIFTNNISLLSSDLAVATDNDSFSDITFNGNSNVYGGIGGAKIFKTITAGTLTGTTVRFLGAVNATDFSVGAGTASFESGTLTNYGAMNFAGASTTGMISLAPNTGVIGALTTNTDDTGILALGSGSNLTGAVGATSAGLRSINVVGGDDTAGVSATITGAVVDVHSFSLLTNTLTITGGALTIATGGVINTTLASPTLYGNIVVAAGASSLGTGLGVEVLVPSTAYIPVGTKFYIVQSTSGSGAPVTATDPTNSLYTFAVDAAATAGDATIVVTGIPLTSQADPCAEPDPIVPILIGTPGTDDINEVLAAIGALTDQNEVDNARAQLKPSTPSLVAPLVTFRGIRQFQNLWLSRLDMCSEVSEPNKENPDCRGNEPRNGWWLKGFGYSGSQNAQDGSTGYNARTLGTMIAYDAPIGLDTRAGLGFGYARSTINGETFDASTEFDTYQAVAYIGHENGPWFVNGSASFGWNEYSSMRHIEFPGVNRRATAKYSGQDYTAFVNTGFHLPALEFTITPLASLQYTHMNIDGYTERGAGDIGLKTKSQDYDFLESGLGAKVERYFSNSEGMSFVPEGHFNWFHELSNPDLKQTARYTAAGSGSFTTSGPKTADDMFNVGGGLTLLSCACSATTWSLEGVYDYDWNNDGYFANQVMVRLTSRF